MLRRIIIPYEVIEEYKLMIYNDVVLMTDSKC
jgi:hypothetical protein